MLLLAPLRVAARSARFRATTAVAVFILSAIGVAACAFGPVFLDQVAQAQLTQDLTNTAVASRGLTLTSASAGDSPATRLPTGIARGLLADPIASIQADFTYRVAGKDVEGLIVNRSGQCAHVTLTAGRCANSINEAMASSTAAGALGISVGSSITASVVASVDDIKPLVVQVVGLYQPFDPETDYWFSHRYSSAAGVTIKSTDLSQIYLADALFVGASLGPALASPSQYELQQVPTANAVEFPLRVDRVRTADIAELRRVLIDARSVADKNNLRADSQLSAVFDQVARAHTQAANIVAGLAIELALLILIVVAIIVTAAADQRRPDFALARLRGRTRRSAGAMLFTEFAPIMVISALPGFVLAVVLAIIVDHWWLSGLARPTVDVRAVAAAAAVLVVELVIAYVIGRRAAGAPVHDLLRRIPRQTSTRGVGAVEFAVMAVAVAGLVVVRSGDHQNLLAVVTPALLALVVGLALSRILTAVAGRVGRRRLWRGRVGTALAALQFARRPGMRRVVIMLTVAAALAVSAAAQSSVAAANREVRSRFEVGAPVVLNVAVKDPVTLAAAVRAADPGQSYAAPVVSYSPPGAPAAVSAVDPLAFQRVAAWGWPDDRPSAGLLAAINPLRPPAITFTATSVQLTIRAGTLTRTAATDVGGSPRPVYLLLGYRAGTGVEQSARLGPLPEKGGAITTTLTGAVGCSAGCSLTSLSVLRGTADTDYVTLVLPLAISAGTTPLDLGSSGQWGRSSLEVPSDSAPTQTVSFTATGTTGELRALSGSSPTEVRQLHQPIGIPAIVAGAAQLATDGNGYLSAPNIDGLTASYTRVGAVPQMPGPGGPGFIVDLAIATAAALGPIAPTAYSVWLGGDDPARERAVVDVLQKNSVTVTGRTAAREHQRLYDEASPAWSMKLAWVTAIVATFLAILVLLISIATTARSRRDDLTVARQLGLSARAVARATRTETLVAVIVPTLAGGLVGVIAAQLAAASIPIFINPVTPPAIHHPIEWLAGITTAGAVLVALIISALVVARFLTARIGGTRLRGGA